MGEPTSIKAQVYMPGKSHGKLHRLLTFDTISEWIKLQGFDDYTTNGLIELASKYPTQALPSFRKNFNLMIERVRAKRRQESTGQTEAEKKGIDVQEPSQS
jgi:hypothetical protein